MSPTKRGKRVSSIRTPSGMGFFPFLLPACGEKVASAEGASQMRGIYQGGKKPSPASRTPPAQHPLPAEAGRGKQNSHLLICLDDRLPVRAGLLQPILRELLADLLEAGCERVARRQHLHPFG